jgi:hypothetical protein
MATTMLTGIPNGMRAGAIMADPGVAFACRSAKGEGRSPQRHYRCTPLVQLTEFPVADIAAADCFYSCGSRCARCFWSSR